MRFWVGVTAAFGAGTLIGMGVGILLVEDKLKKEYKEATASHWRVVQAVKIDMETPPLDADVITIKPRSNGVALEGDVVEFNTDATVLDITTNRQSTNPYHQAVEQTSSIDEPYVSFAELSEEDYMDDDGRVKEQMTMLFSDGDPTFFYNGVEVSVSDAMDMVGSTIVDDMREAVRRGEPIVWVRNNQTDVDYEVVFEQP